MDSSAAIIKKPTGLLLEQIQVLYALMMHDIKARFFGSGLGHIVMVMWPLGHIVVIVAIYMFSGRITPFGSSLVLFTVTGVIPFVASTYIAKFIIIGVIQNKAFLQYPIIKPLDMITARAVLELLNTFFIVFVVLAAMLLGGIDVMPNDPTQAALALLAAMLLGVGLGYLNGMIALAIPMWNLMHALFSIITYASAGILFMPDAVPEPFRYYLSFNPVMHAVVWMRGAFYAGYGTSILDKPYLIGWGIGSLALGLVAERLFRGFLIQAR